MGFLPRTLGGLMEDFANAGFSRLAEETTATAAPVNIRETDGSYELELAAPGLKKEDFKISIDKDILSIAFEQKNEEKEENTENKWIRNEYRMRSFKRSFTLGEKINATGIAAKYADGILQLTLPKKEAAEPVKHEIAVN